MPLIDHTPIILHTEKDPFLSGRSARIFGSLDIAAMRSAASHLVFQGDFAAFLQNWKRCKTTICDVRNWISFLLILTVYASKFPQTDIYVTWFEQLWERS